MRIERASRAPKEERRRKKKWQENRLKKKIIYIVDNKFNYSFLLNPMLYLYQFYMFSLRFMIIMGMFLLVWSNFFFFVFFFFIETPSICTHFQGNMKLSEMWKAQGNATWNSFEQNVVVFFSRLLGESMRYYYHIFLSIIFFSLSHTLCVMSYLSHRSSCFVMSIFSPFQMMRFLVYKWKLIAPFLLWFLSKICHTFYVLAKSTKNTFNKNDKKLR